jgi:hypothetical protein
MFVMTRDYDYLNTSEIKRIVDREGKGHVAVLANGEHEWLADAPRYLVWPTVQAQPGFYMLMAWLDKNGSYTVADRYPIVAWSLGEFGPEPIALGQTCLIDGMCRAILTPDGGVHDADNPLTRWADEARWLAHETERAAYAKAA